MVSLCRNKISDSGLASKFPGCVVGPRWDPSLTALEHGPDLEERFFEVFSFLFGSFGSKSRAAGCPKGFGFDRGRLLQDGQLNRGGISQTTAEEKARDRAEARKIGRRAPRGVASKHSAELRAMPRRTWMNRDSRETPRDGRKRCWGKTPHCFREKSN